MKKVYSAPQSAVEKKVLRTSILTGSGPTFGGKFTGAQTSNSQVPDGEEAGARSRNSLD